MPTYEYHCDSCSKNFDLVQKMTDDPLSVCPDCGHPVERVLSANFALNFSGKGFYTTDAKKASEKKNEIAKKSEEACTNAQSCAAAGG